MPIADYITKKKHVDFVTGARLGMFHNGDYVTLKGPITISVSQTHRRTEKEPWTTEPTYTIRIREAENRTITNKEYTRTNVGDWNTEVALVSED